MSLVRNLISLAFIASVTAVSPSFAQQSSVCGPIFNGAILNVAFECWNESIFVKIDSTRTDQYGWQYVADGADDHDYAGAEFQIHGVAVKETSDQLCVVYNSDYSFESGYVDSGALNGSVRWGDIFLNMSNQPFKETLDSGSMYGIRFDASNDSGVTGTGVYKNITAQSVGTQNLGVANRQGYENHLSAYGGRTAVYGDFDRFMSYYTLDLGYNEISSGTKLGEISLLSASDLSSMHYDSARFSGPHNTGLCFRKNLIVDACGVVGGDGSSCADCAGVSCGTSVVDQCGVCGGTASDSSQCQSSCSVIEATPEVLGFEKRLLAQAKALRKRFNSDKKRAINAQCGIALKPLTTRMNGAYGTIKNSADSIFTQGVEVCGDSCVTASYAAQVEALSPNFKEMEKSAKTLANKVKGCYKKNLGSYKGSGAGVKGTINNIHNGLTKLVNDCRDKQICPPGSH